MPSYMCVDAVQCVRVCGDTQVLCVTWNRATTRSARQRLDMKRWSGVWCRLRLSNTTNTSPLPSNAIAKMTDSTTTSATARAPSRTCSEALFTKGVTEAGVTTANSAVALAVAETVTKEMDMMPRQGRTKQGRREEGKGVKRRVNERKNVFLSHLLFVD